MTELMLKMLRPLMLFTICIGYWLRVTLDMHACWILFRSCSQSADDEFKAVQLLTL